MDGPRSTPRAAASWTPYDAAEMVPCRRLTWVALACSVSLPAAYMPRRGVSIRLRSSKFSAISDGYNAEQIQVLEGLEPVRKRPGMYIGSTSAKGLHHLIFEVVDNAVDEALAGHCSRIDVVLETDGSCTVRDDGRGIPTEIHSRTGKSALETVMTVLHAGGKFGGEASGYKVSGGLHGVGVSVVNALSRDTYATVRRNGQLFKLHCRKGHVVGDVQVEDAPAVSKHLEDEELPGDRNIWWSETGTEIRFLPDTEIFKEGIDFVWDRIAGRLDELAYLNAGLRIRLVDRRTKGEDRQQVFQHDGGIEEWLGDLCAGKPPLYEKLPMVVVHGAHDGTEVEVALQWSKEQYNDVIVGFANGIKTGDGGTHMDAIKSVITRMVNNLGKKTSKIKKDTGSLPGEFIREGLTAIVTVKVAEPEFEGQTKSRLGNTEVRKAVDTVVANELQRTFDFHPKFLDAILEKSMEAADAAAAAKAAREVVRRKSILTSTVLPGKLADCSSRDRSVTELYLVEGDSAAGSAKQARDRRMQAVLPLRGKILNIEKAKSERIYKNEELQAMISAIGLGMRGSAVDTQKLRYSRIILMTDADVDGAHIRILLLTFFYRYQRELIEQGFVCIACPPLYKVTEGKSKSLYLFEEEELTAFKAKSKRPDSISVQRFKGLGEMMPQQLWDTTMNPRTRILKQVTVEDAAMADSMFTLLMGDDVEGRRDYISENAAALERDDLDF